MPRNPGLMAGIPLGFGERNSGTAPDCADTKTLDELPARDKTGGSFRAGDVELTACRAGTMKQ